MRRSLLAFGSSSMGLVGLAAGCGGSTFTAGSSAVDAAVEAGPLEAGEAGDASAPVDAGPPWCTGRTETFCEDFDEYPSIGSLLGMTTWPVNEQQAGSFAFDTVNAPSAPNALQVMGDDGADVVILKSFTPLPKMPQKVTLTFDLRINGPGSPGVLSVAGFAAIAFGSSINDGYVALAIGDGPTLAALWVQSTSAVAVDAGAFKIAPSSQPFPSTGLWAGNFTVEIDYAPPAPPCLQVSHGTTALLAQCLALPPDFASPTVLSIVLGDVAGGGAHTGSVNLEFDNILFNIK